MRLSTDAIRSPSDIHTCMSICYIQDTMQRDEHLQRLKTYITEDWPFIRNEPRNNAMLAFRDKPAVKDGMDMKNRRIIILMELEQQAIEQLQINQLDIKKTRLMVGQSVYWVNMDNDIGEAIKNYHIPSISAITI